MIPVNQGYGKSPVLYHALCEGVQAVRTGVQTGAARFVERHLIIVAVDGNLTAGVLGDNRPDNGTGADRTTVIVGHVFQPNHKRAITRAQPDICRSDPKRKGSPQRSDRKSNSASCGKRACFTARIKPGKNRVAFVDLRSKSCPDRLHL